MKNKIIQLKETNLKIARLLEELEEAYKIEEFKKNFPNTKLFSFKKTYDNKVYEIKFLKLVPEVAVTIFSSDYLFHQYMKTKPTILYGRITDFEKSELDKLKIISIKEIN